MFAPGRGSYNHAKGSGNLHRSDSDLQASMPRPSPDFLSDEAGRLRVIEDYDPDALEDDPELNAIVKFAARLCNVPVAQVTLVEEERQRFLAREGIEERETPRSVSFCAHTMLQPDMLEVVDATQDPRFADNPLVQGDPFVRYYAGQPLVSVEGAPLGSICVVDLAPRENGLSEMQREGLQVLAQAVMRRLQSRREGLAATREIERSEARFRALADSMPDIAFSANHEGQFDYFNQRWHEYTGLTGIFDQEASQQVLHPDEYDGIMEHWAKCLASGKPYENENRLRRSDGTWRWVLVRALPVTINSSGRLRWFGTITDVDEAHKLSESRDMLAKELSHRIKNIFAVVTGLVSLQSRKAPEHKGFADQLIGTLHALGRAHDFVRPASGSTRESLLGLLDVLFAPYRTGTDDARIRVNGADASISPRAATPLALVFHELATNSAKYGALSVDEGHVDLAVTDKGTDILLRWTERGGPEPEESGETGFGSRMVEMAVTGQLQGSWERHFEKEGLVVELVLQKKAIAPSEESAELEPIQG